MLQVVLPPRSHVAQLMALFGEFKRLDESEVEVLQIMIMRELILDDVIRLDG